MKLWDFLQEANIDNRQGLGNVPDNQNVDYLGLRVQMKPSVFLRLAATLYREQAASTDYIKQHVQKGGAIASPWLVIDIPQAWEQGDFQQAVQVSGHEGRNRMWAVLETDGDEPIECHLFFSHGLRNRHILPSWIAQLNQRMIPERSNKAISGPFFTMHSPATTMQETTRTTSQGGRGTLKAKITRRYGGKVTCDKVKKLKSRENATAHDKSQANWFLNMQDCNETSVSEVFQSRAEYKFWNWDGFLWSTHFVFDGHRVELTLEHDDHEQRGPQDIIAHITRAQNVEIPETWRGYTLAFTVDDSIDITGELGTLSVRILGRVVQLVRGFLTIHPWDYITFSGAPGSRNRLYRAIANRLAKEIGGQVIQYSTHFAILKQHVSSVGKISGQTLKELVNLPKTPIEWKQQIYPNGRRYVTTFEFDNLKVDIRINSDWTNRYHLQNAMLVDTSEINPQAMGYSIMFMVNDEIIKTGLLGQKSSTLLAQTFGRILQWLKTHKWDYIIFTGSRGSRNKLYGMISRQLAREFGAKLHFDFDTSDFVVYKPSTFAQELVREALTWQLPPKNWAVHAQHARDIMYKFTVDGEKYYMEVTNIPEPHNRGIYDIEFFHDEHGMDITGLGASHAMKVFSAVKQLASYAQERLTDLPVNAWYFSARGSSRQKLYLRLAQQLAQEIGWKLTTTQALMPLQGDRNMQGYLIYSPEIADRVENPPRTTTQEAQETPRGAALTVFDIDDTLMHTHAAVWVVNAKGEKRRLTAQEFNTYELQPQEHFDFQEFEDSRLFHDTSRPIKNIWRTAQQTLANTGRRPGSRVVVITARGPFNDHKLFLQTFEKHGLDMSKVQVFTVGGARNKKALIRKLLQQGNYTETRIFDDHLGNLRDFLSLHQEFPHVTFKAFAVGNQGRVGEPVVLQGTTNE